MSLILRGIAWNRAGAARQTSASLACVSGKRADKSSAEPSKLQVALPSQLQAASAPFVIRIVEAPGAWRRFAQLRASKSRRKKSAHDSCEPLHPRITQPPTLQRISETLSSKLTASRPQLPSSPHHWWRCLGASPRLHLSQARARIFQAARSKRLEMDHVPKSNIFPQNPRLICDFFVQNRNTHQRNEKTRRKNKK